MSRPILLVLLDGVPAERIGRQITEGILGAHGQPRLPAIDAIERGTAPTAAAALSGFRGSRIGISGDLVVSFEPEARAALPDRRSLAAMPLSEVAAAQGLRCACWNVPLTAPPPSIEGLMVVPWGQSKRTFPRSCWPADRLARLKGCPGLDVDRLAMNLSEEMSVLEAALNGDPGGWRTLQRQRDEAWLNAAAWLGQERFDLTIIYLEGMGRALRLTSGDSVSDHVDVLSDGIRRLQETVQSDVIVAGLRPVSPLSRWIALNSSLEAAGLLRWQAGATDLRDPFDQAGLSRLRASLPLVDLEASAAFCADASGAVVTVTPGRDFDAVAVQLSAVLNEAGVQIAGIDAGSRSLRLRLGCGEALLLGPAHSTPLDPSRPIQVPSGGGWWASSASTVDEIDLTDLAPSVLHAAGGTVPVDMPGRVVLGLGGQSSVDRPVVRRGSSHTGLRDARSEAGETQQDSETQIFERLKALGYVE